MFLTNEQATREIKDLIKVFREVEQADPNVPRFNEATLPKRRKHESPRAWGLRCVKRMVDWRNEIAKHHAQADLVKIAALTTIAATNTDPASKGA